MPLDQLTQQLLLRQPPKIGTPIPLPTEDQAPPSTSKSIFEGGVDSLLGLLGVGPETKANLSGQLVAAGLPLVGGLKGVPGMYSRLDKAAAEMPDKLTAAAAKNYLMQRATKEEMDWRSALSTLEGKNPMEKVQKPEIQDYLAKNPLDVEVKELEENPPKIPSSWGGPPVTPAERAKYGPSGQNQVLPGGQNYRETLIKLADQPPTKPPVPDAHWNSLSPAEQNELAASYSDVNPTEFRSNHFDGPNILAHVRHNERDLAGPTPAKVEQLAQPEGWQAVGPRNEFLGHFPTEEAAQNLGRSQAGSKGRFLEEVQSDWHEQGREEGYARPRTPENDALVDNLKQQHNAFRQQAIEARTKANAAFIDGDANNHHKWATAEREYHAQMDKLENDIKNIYKGVPNAPFKESWPDLALKQQLLDVSRRPDLEWLGWTPGEVQNKRYDLSQHVSELKYDPKEQKFWAYDPEGYQTQMHENVTPQKLVELIGKDAASRIVAQPLDQHGFHSLSGENLQIGGEGMKKFYDERLPNTMNKLLKPFGGRVEQADLTLPVTQGSGRSLESMNPSTIKAWIARLSPEMKAQIQEKGLPLLLALLARQQNQSQPDSPNQNAK